MPSLPAQHQCQLYSHNSVVELIAGLPLKSVKYWNVLNENKSYHLLRIRTKCYITCTLYMHDSYLSWQPTEHKNYFGWDCAETQTTLRRLMIYCPIHLYLLDVQRWFWSKMVDCRAKDQDNRLLMLSMAQTNSALAPKCKYQHRRPIVKQIHLNIHVKKSEDPHMT